MRLTVIEHAGATTASGPSALMVAPGGTIGRSPDNHLVLPDKQRRISRLQATVHFDDDGAMLLRNMSAVLPIGVNGRALTQAQQARVTDGDRVSIGSYVLEAANPQRAASAVAEASMPGVLAPELMTSTIDRLQRASPASDVFSDFLGAGALPIGDAQAAAPLPLATAPPMAPSFPAETPSAADWDAILADAPRGLGSASVPTADPLAHEPFDLPSQAGRNPVDPLAALNPDAARAMPALTLPYGVDPLSLFAADDSARSPLSDPSPSPLMHAPPLGDAHPALDLLARSPVAAAGYTPSHPVREWAGQFRPPLPVGRPVGLVEPAQLEVPSPPEPLVAAQRAVAQVPPASLPPPRSPSPSPSSEALHQAFLEGAGVPDLVGRQPLDAEAMRQLGRLMRAFTDGTIELLSSRAMLKREVHAEITMIVDEENNPFKILPNGRAVLMQMFGARMPGFVPPEAAVRDALADLQSHQLGMVAGMRAALLTLLRRFDPARLNNTTPHDGSLGEKLLPGGRAARLWRQLQQMHAETTAAVEDDFQAVFGRAFQQAYDREMERLKEARRG